MRAEVDPSEPQGHGLFESNSCLLYVHHISFQEPNHVVMEAVRVHEAASKNPAWRYWRLDVKGKGTLKNPTHSVVRDGARGRRSSKKPDKVVATQEYT
jgi:hypothetical protein